MGRPTRHIEPDSWHHVMARGADRQDIFTDDHDRTHFEQLLGDLTADFDVDVHAYCLMGNHFHALVHCRNDELSSGMRHVLGNHARAYNERHGRSGPLFGERFRSVAVGSDAQVVVTARYIHRNPLDLVPIGALAAYRWSSLGRYVGRRTSPPWLSTRTIDRLMRGCDHLQYVCEPQPTDLTPLNGVPSNARPSIHDVESAVARASGVSPEHLRQSTPGAGNSERMLMLTLALEFRVASAAALASHFGLASGSAVRMAARRGRVRLHDDPSFRRLRSRVVANL